MKVSRGPADLVRILVVESDPTARRVLSSDIPGGFQQPVDTTFASEVTDALALMRGAEFDLVLADVETIGGADRIADFARITPTAVVIALARNGSVSGAVNALRAGADDILIKPITAAKLASCYGDSVSRRHSAIASDTAKPLPLSTDFEGFVGSSHPMREIYEQIRRIATSRAPVFITGESGTGKELCAEAVHARSERNDGPFIAINCSAIPSELMESEIFGHMRGAFTGATDDRLGAAELAHGGTLFLDEIGEMDLGLQSKLLRFIQTGTVRRVGDTQTRSVDVRFICATNRDPLAEVDSGRFREDLFYRLHVLPIDLPPLRNRRDDILPLARTFLRKFAAEERKPFAAFDTTAEAALANAPWPGNVRQLENVIRRIVVLYDDTIVRHTMLPGALRDDTEIPSQNSILPHFPEASNAQIAPFWQQEQVIIESALAAFNGNISRAAAALQIAPSTIYRKRQSWTSRLSQERC